MSTLKTHNLQSPDSGSVNIAMAPNAGMVVAGLSTYSNQINVGSNIQLGSAGVVTATTFSGSGANLTSIPAGNLTGTVADARITTLTASKLSGALPAIDGSNLTGVSGFSTAMSSTPNTFLNDCFKTTFSHTIPNGTQIDITNNETTSGKTVFTRLGQIKVATGATFHVSAGTTFVMDVLGVF
tara:strand:+ start:124 stop:672 length:549 start_codon:yes stop_codon:yes gene_type:complete